MSATMLVATIDKEPLANTGTTINYRTQLWNLESFLLVRSPMSSVFAACFVNHPQEA